MRRVATPLFWILLVSSILAGGCAKDDPIALTVGVETRTLGEFEKAFWFTADRDSTIGPDAAGIQKFAEIYAEEVLVALLAREQQPILEPARQERLDEYQERLMVEQLRREEYGEAYSVDDKTLKRAYEKLRSRRKLRRMVLPTESDARDVRRALREGAAFGKVAKARSLDERTRESGGEIGWLVYTDLPSGDRDVVFSLKAGEISPVLPAGDRFALYLCDDVGENASRGTLEEERALLEQGILESQVRTGKADYEETLLSQYNFQTHPAEIAWATVHMRKKTARAERGNSVLETGEERDGVVYSRGGIPWEGPPVAPADTGRVLATFDPPDGRVIPILVFDQLLSKPQPTWPKFDTSEDVEDLIRDLVIERLEVREAFARGYDEIESVAYLVNQRENDIRRRQYIRNEMRTPNIPTVDVVEAEYLSRIEEYQNPETRRFVAANVASWEAAKEAAEALRSGISLSEIERSMAPADSFRSTGSQGTPAMTYGQSPLLDDVLFNTEIGGVSDPILVDQGYTVAQVIEITPASTTPFEEVRYDIQARMVDVLADAALEKVLDEARKKWPVSIDYTVINNARPRPPE